MGVLRVGQWDSANELKTPHHFEDTNAMQVDGQHLLQLGVK